MLMLFEVKSSVTDKDVGQVCVGGSLGGNHDLISPMGGVYFIA